MPKTLTDVLGNADQGRAMELLSRWFPKKDPLAISAGNQQ